MSGRILNCLGLSCRFCLGAEGELAEQDCVQGEDDGDGEPSGDAGARRGAEAVHHVLPVGEQKQRDEREGQCEAEHDLREDEDAERVKASGDDDDSGNHGDKAAQEDGKADGEEAFNNDLAGHDADGGGREPGAEQGNCEDDGGGGAEERPEGVIRLLNGWLQVG